MSRRFVVLSALAVAGASAVASVGVMATAPAAHGAGDVCVSYGGVNYAQFGTASCSSTPGNVAIAAGSNTQAFSGPGTNNTATAVNSSSIPTFAVANGNNSTATIVNHNSRGVNGVIVGGDNDTGTVADCVGGLNGNPTFFC